MLAAADPVVAAAAWAAVAVGWALVAAMATGRSDPE